MTEESRVVCITCGRVIPPGEPFVFEAGSGTTMEWCEECWEERERREEEASIRESIRSQIVACEICQDTVSLDGRRDCEACPNN